MEPLKDDMASDYVRQRVELVGERDKLTDTSQAPVIVGVIHGESSRRVLMPVIEGLAAAGLHVEAVDGRSPAGSPAEPLALGGLVPRDAAWLDELYRTRFDMPVVVLYGPYVNGSGADEASPVRAAEYGVRVVHVLGPSDYAQDRAEDLAFDTDAHRTAWRLYAASERQRDMVAKYCSVGAATVRVTGDPTTDRLLAASDASSPEALDGRTWILWHPEIRRSTGPRDPRHFLHEWRLLLDACEDLGLLLHPSSWLPADPKVKEAWLEELEAMAQLPGVHVDWDEDPVPTLAGADALVTGANGPVAQMIAADKPILYQHRRGAALDIGADYLLALEVATEWEDVAAFTKKIVAGERPGETGRSLARDRYFSHEGDDALRRLIDDLVYSLWVETHAATGRASGPMWRELGPFLSVSLIVKDEAANIAECLSSIATLGELVHEVVVYDTGSTDETVAIAESKGAMVHRGYWNGDFARARNDAVSLCSGRWVFMVDADDRVSGDADGLLADLAAGLTIGPAETPVACITVRDMRKGGVLLQEYPVPRFLRPDKSEWVGRIHEEPRRRDGRGYPFIRMNSDHVVIQTHGYADDDLLRRKTQRNYEIAGVEVAAAEQAGDADRLIHALVDRARSGLGHGKVNEALADFERVWDIPSGHTYRWWGLEQYAQLLLDLGRLEEAEAICEDLRREGARPEVIGWLEAQRLASAGRTTEALEIVRSLGRVVNSMEMEQDPALIMQARLRLAVTEGHFTEALAILIPLMASRGRVDGRGNLLLRLWGRRPPQELARRLLHADRGFIGAVIEELKHSSDPGPEVASLLSAASAGASSSASA